MRKLFEDKVFHGNNANVSRFAFPITIGFICLLDKIRVTSGRRVDISTGLVITKVISKRYCFTFECETAAC